MGDDQHYVRRLLVTVSVVTVAVCLLFAAWQLAYVLLLLFAATLFAVFLEGLTTSLRRYLRMPRWLAIPLVTLVLFGVLGLGGYLVGPAVADQVMQLSEKLPQATQRLKEFLGQYNWGQSLLDWANSQWQNAPMSPGKIVGGLTGAFSTLFGTISDLLLILVIGFYLAFHPQPYRQGFLYLFPQSRRRRLGTVLQTTSHALHWWLIGRGISMAVVGVLTAVGLLIIGMPLILALAVLAGLLSFVPFLGPIVAAIPAVLVGLIDSPGQALNVVLVYTVVQLLESNFITPFVQVRAVSLPPAVMLSSQVLMGVLFGMLGLLLATPMMVALIVLIQMLYINDVLGEDVKALGH